MKELEQADQLMTEGKKEEAALLLKRVLERADNKKGTYEDAVNIYLLGSMYREAKEVFELYKRRTHRELTTDVTIEEVQQEEEAARREKEALESSPVKVFRRRTLRERDYMLGSLRWRNLYNLLSPITEVEIHEGKIVLKKKLREYDFRWSEITDASVTTILPKYPGYWREYPERWLTLRAGSKTFHLEVSDQYSAFRGSDALVGEVEKHVGLRRTIKRPKLYLGFPIEWWLTFVFLLALIVWQAM